MSITVQEPTQFEKYVAETQNSNNVLDVASQPVQQTEVVEAAEVPETAEPQEVGETAEAAETETDDEGGEEVEAEPVVKKKGGFQRKLERKEAEIAALRAQLEAFSTGGTTAERQSQPTIEGRPTLEQFNYEQEAYEDALFDWKLEQKAAREKAAEQAVTWQSRVEEAAKEFEDFDDYADVQIPLTPSMREFLVESEIGPKLGYTLAKNTKEAQRIFGLSPVMQVKELAKLELAITGKNAETPEKPKPAISKAPKPPTQLAGRSPSNPAAMPDPKDFGKYEKWRKEGGRI